MEIVLAADHRGFTLKERLKESLTADGHAVHDVGAFALDPSDDYVDFSRSAVERIAGNPERRGILCCGSGHGMAMVANKYPAIRAALAFNRKVAVQSREHEDANVLILPADWMSEGEARDVVAAWLTTPFSSEERHIRRLEKIREIEEKNFK